MKKFEEAELNVMLVENSVICTSGGCVNTPNAQGCSHGVLGYDSASDSIKGG